MRQRLCRSGLASIALASAVVFSGCFWPLPGQGPDRQAHNQTEGGIAPATVASLHQAWSKTLDAGPVSDPVTSGFGVVVSGRRSTYTLAPESGQTRWTHAVAAPLEVTQPFVRREDVYVGHVDKTATASTTTEGLDV